ncbi:uncharacterized protein AB675_10599 [Cyphellophora attinorum]|uniref:Uncharacterized protein n=1 Tax=Cyphellophora attinorum TaxID=1664694 RepID=A0A0N1HBU1_9EURO|nr:uncharacterized protein AB675_10599 [Phialophora attinorum]KPI40946.1 hypothetical protein AB675_10599 [Phialophora attinorum]
MSTTLDQPSSVTELALLRVPLSAGASSPIATRTDVSAVKAPIRAGLLKAKNAMQDFSGESFAFAILEADEEKKFESSQLQAHSQGREEAETEGEAANMILKETVDVLIIGGWPSVDFHVRTWLPSPENQALLVEIGNSGATTRWMWHVDRRREDLEGLLTSAAASSPGGLHLHRLVIDNPEMMEKAEVLLADLQGGVGVRGVVSAWRIDPGYWAEGETDMRANAGVDAAELVILLSTGMDDEVDKRAGDVINQFVGLAVDSTSRVGTIMNI